MKYTITKEKYVKEIIPQHEIDIPEEPLYLFITGIRRAYSIVPKWTTWNKEHYNKEEEIYEFQIVEVDPSNYHVKRYNIGVSDISNILNSRESYLQDKIRLVEAIIEPVYYKRTKEQFMQDYNNVIEHINMYL